MTNIDRLKGLLFLTRVQRESPEIVSTIRRIIMEDPEALDFFVRWSHFEASLLWYVNELNTDRNAVVTHVRGEVRRNRLTRFLTTIVCTTLLVFIGFQVCLLAIQHSVSPLQIRPVVARIEGMDGVIWTENPDGMQSLIRSGDRLRSRQGKFIMQMDNGSLIACSGPIDMRAVSSIELYVEEGSLCVQVPAPAQGFKITTKTWSIVDLGTIFGALVHRDGTADVHVIKGLVQTSNDTIGRRKIATGQGASVAADGQLAGLFVADSSLFSTQLASLAGVAGLSKSLVLLNEPPRSVKFNELILPDQACLFREQTLFTDREVAVSQAAPGIYDSKNLPEVATIPAGTKLTTYFLHAQNSHNRPVSGHVTFEGTIVALASSSADLSLTDACFGHPGVLYPTSTGDDPNAGARGTFFKESSDFIELSSDLKTLRFNLSCASAIRAFDQIRIFVVPSGS